MKYQPRVRTHVAALAAMVMGASVASADSFRMIVTELEPPLVPNSIQSLAIELGYYEAEGVDVELIRVQQTPSALAALQAGEGEMANISVGALLQLMAQGVDDLRAVISPNKALPFVIVAADSINSPEEISGKRFGVGRVGSLDYSLSSVVLEAHGVSLDGDVELIGLGQPSVRAQALAAGQIDATTVSIGVWLSMPDTEGLHILVPQDEYYAAAPVVNLVNIVSSNTIENRSDDLHAVIRALVKISRDFANDPSLWVDAMVVARPDVTRETLEELAVSFAESWSVNGGLNLDELRFTADFLYEGEDFVGVERASVEQWVDFGPVDAVLEELGVIDSMDNPTR